jgi:quercetin dioxygenase-like cupin family protein
MARDYGLVLLEDGSLIDTAGGQSVPAGARPMPKTSAEQIAGLQRLTQDAAETLVARLHAPLERREELARGVFRVPLIGDEGKFPWDHGFSVDRLEMAAGSALPERALDKPHVLFVHEGEIAANVAGETARLARGDTMTVPVGAARGLTAETAAIVFSVTGA